MSDDAPASLNDTSTSADAAGLGVVPAAAPVAPCKFGAGPQHKLKPLEYCDIKQLQLVLSTTGKTQTITIDHSRTAEPVNPAAVAQEYRAQLLTYDVIIEALADIDDTTGASHAASAERKPLDVKVTAKDSVSHTSFTPHHPHCALNLKGSDPVVSDGGAPVSGRFFAPDRGAYSRTTWGALWPFGDDRVRTYAAVGTSCGVLPIPRKPNGGLAAELVVLPYEEWTITVGLKGVREGSSKTESNRFNNQDGESNRRVSSTTTVMKRVGDSQTTTTTQNMETPSGIARTRVAEKKTTLDYHLLSTDSETTTTTKQSWTKRPRTKKDDDEDYRKISIKRSIAGREVEADVSETIKKILKVKEIFDDASKLFDSVKIGWSISMSFEILSGNLSLGWGIRWPQTYSEQSRVWYVERFYKASGSLDVVTGSVTGFFGFAVDPWYAPVTVEVGAYLSASVKVSIAASFDYAYTNSALHPAGQTGSLDPSATIKFEAGGKANGRAFGYSVESRLALEAGATLTFHGEISSRNPPYLKGSLVIGNSHDEADKSAGAPKADGIRLVGELIITGETVRRRKIDPIVLVDGVECFKDKYFLGEAPPKAPEH